jgi:membrane-associated protease RseP (regulator of RpoE activity)
MILNLLPLPPLDGGRIVVSLLPHRAGLAIRATGTLGIPHPAGAAVHRVARIPSCGRSYGRVQHPDPHPFSDF